MNDIRHRQHEPEDDEKEQARESVFLRGLNNLRAHKMSLQGIGTSGVVRRMTAASPEVYKDSTYFKNKESVHKTFHILPVSSFTRTPNYLTFRALETCDDDKEN